MTDRIDISTRTLRTILNRLVDHLEVTDGERVLLEHDYFWSVPSPAIYNPYEQPNELTIGQLSESWANLEQVLADDAEVAYAFVWLGDILRAVGHEVLG